MLNTPQAKAGTTAPEEREREEMAMVEQREEEGEEGVAGRAELVPKYWKKLKEQKEPASLGPHMVKADSTEGKPNTKAGK